MTMKKGTVSVHIWDGKGEDLELLADVSDGQLNTDSEILIIDNEGNQSNSQTTLVLRGRIEHERDEDDPMVGRTIEVWIDLNELLGVR